MPPLVRLFLYLSFTLGAAVAGWFLFHFAGIPYLGTPWGAVGLLAAATVLFFVLWRIGEPQPR